ncbi:MAG: 1-acyl-sn-glycerol-3-phosphate acyltransferase [candidate division Zixibacteria bacterium]|nr:1-acyl-sn-glycerol-3-phosphate acyltransferase [candidate division Zixibacteria bacterium]
MRLWYRFILTIARVAYFVLWRPRYVGRQNLPDGPFLLCPNHRSWFDPPLMALLVPREIGFLAKTELFKNCAFRWLIWSVNARPIQRGGIDRASVDHVLGILQSGRPMLVFPEGTRSRSGQMQPPRPGVGRLARLAAVPVVPVNITGSFHLGRVPFRWGRLIVTVGEPMSAQEALSYADDKSGYRALSQRIMRRICDLSDDPGRDWASSQTHSGHPEPDSPAAETL